MNPLPIFIYILLIVNCSASCEAKLKPVKRCDSRQNSDFPQNENFPRQISGVFYDDFTGIFGTVFRYVQFGFNFLSKKIGKVILHSVTSNKDKINYKGFQVLRIDAINEEQVKHLNELPEEIDGTQYWTPPVENYFTDLLVSPGSLDEVKTYLNEKKIDYEILIRDLQKVILYENPKMNKDQRDLLIGKRGHPMTWMRYHRYSDIVRYMDFLAFNYPKQVEILNIGYSTEGLPLKVVKVSSNNFDIHSHDNKKPSFWIDGGMHGREWITSAVVLYILKQLVENYSKHKNMADSAIWYFLPVANPDGYEYSHSTDRLWKKTRSKHDFSDSSFIKNFLFGSCEGVDLNKNFDYHWGEKGASDDPCREGYAGPRPFSEPETRAISNFIMDKKKKIKLYVTLHSYSQMWLIPWSYTTRKTSDYIEVEKMAKKAVQAIALVTGSHYDVGPSASMVYPISGTSEDWAKGVAGIKYSYSVKLRDRGSFGFLLPAAQILPTSKEIFIAVKVLAKMITTKMQPTQLTN